MKAVYKELLDNSIAASLSAIEIYNKPDFKYRNQIFVILVTNSWELLLKAKVLKNNSSKIRSLYKYTSDGKILKNRTGTPMTIDINECMLRLDLNRVIIDNLKSLIEIRDLSIHFYNKEELNYLVYSLSAASLRNYNKLCKEWFNKDLLQYNFYILPLGFDYNFKSFSLLDFQKFPVILRKIIEDISQKQLTTSTDDGFQFTCEIETKLISAKKIVEDEVATIKIDNSLDGKTGAFVYSAQKITDKYPLSWKELRDKVKSAVPKFNQNNFIKLMNELCIKDNMSYSGYIFKNKKDEEEYRKTGLIKNGTTSIYNYACEAFLISKMVK